MLKRRRLGNNINSDPVYFIDNILNKELWETQEDIVRSVNKFPRTTVKGCHGFGKSFIAGNIILQFLYTYRPSIVLSTAPTYRQVEKLIWKEIRESFENSRIPLGGQLMDGPPILQIIKDRWYAMGLSTNDSDRFQGFHEKNILVIADEAAGIPENIFNSIEGILTSQNAHLLLIGNPTSVDGTFFKSFNEVGWNKFSVSAFDTPNFTYLGIKKSDIETGEWLKKYEANGETIPYPKMITPQWVVDKYKRWGESSTLWKTRVMGEFSEENNDNIIPLSWIDAAIERNYELPETDDIEFGVDVAEFGRDSSVIFIKKGRKVLPALTYSKIPLMQLVGNIVRERNLLQAKIIKIDSVGVGTGVEGRLSELGLNTIRINAGELPAGDSEKEKEKYINKRAQMYWCLREMLNPDTQVNPFPIGLPNDEEMIEELLSTRYKINSRGQIQIEPKEDIKARIGRSPDKADALAICMYPTNLLNYKKPEHRAGVW